MKMTPMQLYPVILFILTLVHSQTSFDPGCSFYNGQCVYNVKLGHANQCDSTTKRDAASTSSTASTGTGFQSCSCKDIENVNNDVKSMWSNIQTLQGNFDKLAGKLNVTQDQLAAKALDLNVLQKNNTNIMAQLADKEYLLNKSRVDLANTVSTMNTELDRLRRELTDSNNKLSVCNARSGFTSGQATYTPALYGNYVTTICHFETKNMCNYTMDTSYGTEKWYKGNGRQNTYSGPIEDHTFGAPKGQYMFINPLAQPKYHSSSVGAPTRKAKITSPEFPPAHAYCLRFWCTMYGSDIGTVNVYAQVGGGNGYPIFTHTGEIDKYWHMVEIGLDSEYTASPFKIVFEGTTNSYYVYSHSSSHTNYNTKGYIAVDDVYMYNTTCKSIPNCPAGSRKMTYNNVTSCYTFHLTPLSWYDAVKECKKESPKGHLVSVNTKYEHEYLVDAIENDAGFTSVGPNGWYTSGNDERNENHFVWTNTGYPKALNFTNWKPGQPNNVGDSQNCLLLQYADSRYEWGDVNCADKHPFICEIPL